MDLEKIIDFVLRSGGDSEGPEDIFKPIKSPETGIYSGNLPEDKLDGYSEGVEGHIDSGRASEDYSTPNSGRRDY